MATTQQSYGKIVQRKVGEEVEGGLRGSPLINSYISTDITSCASLNREV